MLTKSGPGCHVGARDAKHSSTVDAGAHSHERDHTRSDTVDSDWADAHDNERDRACNDDGGNWADAHANERNRGRGHHDTGHLADSKRATGAVWPEHGTVAIRDRGGATRTGSVCAPAADFDSSARNAPVEPSFLVVCRQHGQPDQHYQHGRDHDRHDHERSNRRSRADITRPKKRP